MTRHFRRGRGAIIFIAGRSDTFPIHKQMRMQVLSLTVRLFSLGVMLSALSMPVIADEKISTDTLPIIDVHGHLNGDMRAERLVDLMNRAGVKSMVLMARYYGGKKNGGNGSDQQALEYSTRFPGRFIPFVAGQRGDLGRQHSRAWQESTRIGDAFLDEARDKLARGGFYGLGEFILRHYAYSAFGSQGGDDVDLPVDSYLMHRIAGLAAHHHVPVLFHAEAEPDVLAAVRRLVNSEPGTRFIWAHNCGRTSADEIRKLLTDFPNLMCDLGGMSAPTPYGYGTYWPKRTPWMHVIENGFGVLYPEMVALFDDFPDRFMIGTDCAHTPALDTYLARIDRFRKLLTQLKPDTAKKLAYENAERVFGLEQR